MAMNTMAVNDIYNVVNSVVQQATGGTNIVATDTASFVSVAKLGLEKGYDPLLNAISQLVTTTLFSIRPYNRKFAGLQVSAEQYGNHVRKVSMLDKGFEQDKTYALIDGQAVDHYKVNKPAAIQMNWYGQTVFQKSLTIFKDQLDIAFTGPEQFAQFLSAVMLNASNEIEQAHEDLARLTVGNLINGTCASATANNGGTVIHLLTEYKAATGLNDLTATTVLQPDNYAPFIRWVYARVKYLANMMSERSYKYHLNPHGKLIPRATGAQNLKMYLSLQNATEIDAMALSNTFKPEYLKMVDREEVGYWQAIEAPTTIKGKPTYLSTAEGGDLITAEATVTTENIFGVLFDEEAAGYNVTNAYQLTTPMNAAGAYSNIYWHFTDRYWNDFTENCIVLLMD